MLAAPKHELYTLREAASYLRIGLRTAYALASSGELPAVKVGGQWRVSRSALEELANVRGPKEAA